MSKRRIVRSTSPMPTFPNHGFQRPTSSAVVAGFVFALLALTLTSPSVAHNQVTVTGTAPESIVNAYASCSGSAWRHLYTVPGDKTFVLKDLIVRGAGGGLALAADTNSTVLSFPPDVHIGMESGHIFNAESQIWLSPGCGSVTISGYLY